MKKLSYILCFGLLFFSLTYSAGQDIPMAPDENNVAEFDIVEPFKIKLSVNEVLIDVVVLNKKWVKRHGVRFSMLLPVKKPGSYYVRVAVQDTESDRVGSAYQFLEIPDLKNKKPALSSIFMLTSSDDLDWTLSDVKNETEEGVFYPMFQYEEVRSPALGKYKQGDNLQTLTMLYNADAKAITNSEIEIQSILYKDGIEFIRAEPWSLTQNGVNGPDNIPILQGLTISSGMTPGYYMLQIVASNKKDGKNKEYAASHAMGFTVTE